MNASFSIQYEEGFPKKLLRKISRNGYDDIEIILFLPLKGANVVKEFRNSYSELTTYFFLRFLAEK